MSAADIENNKVMYLDLTHKLNDYNEIYNMNTYVQNANTIELDRLNNTNNTLKTRILRMKQEYLLTEAGKRQWAFRTNIMMFTGIVVGLVIILLTMYTSDTIKMSTRALVISCLVILVIYLLLVIYLVVANTERRKYAYDQFYWRQIDPKK